MLNDAVESVDDDCTYCGHSWRVEATHLHTGVVKAVLRPLTADWEDNYTRTGQGTLLVDTLDPSAFDTWPHTTGIYISEIAPDGTRKGRFGGYVDKVSASGAGATMLGLKTLDTFLWHRLLANHDEGVAYSTPADGLSQTVIAKELTNIALTGLGGIQLFPIAETSDKTQVRSWVPSDLKNIGQALQELADSGDGVRWRLEHTFFEGPGRWVTTIRFSDEQNVDRGVKLRADKEAWQYGLSVDGKNQASRMFGVGAGSGSIQMFSVAYDEDADLPEFQATVAWKDITDPATLDAQTVGELTKRRDPATTPTATLVGLEDVPPETLVVGDIVAAELGYGAMTFRDQKARVTGQAWKLVQDRPVTRALTLDPIIRPSLSVKTQTPAVALPPETLEQANNPPPETPITPPVGAAGLVTTVRVGSLNEISGMQYAAGNVYLTNDENNNPQVIVVSLSTGQQVGSLSVSGPSRKDPEALRSHPDGRLFVADIGDNDSKRGAKRLYVAGGGVYEIRYPFGSANAEALLIHPQSGEVFVVTKTGRAVSFGAGPSSGTGSVAASGLVSEISDGTFTNNGKFALFTVAGASVVYVYTFPGWQAAGQIPIPGLPKCEAITIESDCSFLITTEGKNAPIYRVHIPKAFGGCV